LGSSLVATLAVNEYLRKCQLEHTKLKLNHLRTNPKRAF